MLLLHIPSDPIIEHSSGLRFGPYPQSLRREEGTTITSRHDQVQDFGWIKPGPSPNFGVVAEDTAECAAERITEVKGVGEGEGWQARMRGMLEELL